MPFFQKLFSRAARIPERPVLLNEGLELAMDWGENWLAPIQARLHQTRPGLKPGELDGIDSACRQAMNFGHETLYELRAKQGKEVALEDFKPLLVAQFSWVSEANATRLFNQSTYYAWKAGGPAKSV